MRSEENKTSMESSNSLSSGRSSLHEAKAQLASARAQIALIENGNLDEARLNFEEALGIYRDLGKEDGIADTLYNLGKIYHEIGEDEKAVAMLNEASDKYRVLGLREGMAE